MHKPTERAIGTDAGRSSLGHVPVRPASGAPAAR